MKRSACGEVRRENRGNRDVVVRDWSLAAFGLRWLARRLALREAAALERLADVDGTPVLISLERCRLTRSFLAGDAMHRARPRSRDFYSDAFRLLRRIHRAGVAHNDLAKEANWLRLETGKPAIVDFQLACVSRRRGLLFRLLAREDLRHLLKHKHRYAPDALTTRERRLLDAPSLPTRIWRRGFKPAYRFVTRRVLGWPERDGADERQRPLRE